MFFMLLLFGVYSGVTPETTRRHKGRREQRSGPITNEIVIKQEQDTARGRHERGDK